MTLLLQISDLHFGTEQPQVVDALRRLAHGQRPDALIVSGDITQRARPEEFAAARAFCDSLHIARRLVLPGNHDIPLFNVVQRAFNPYRHYLDQFGPSLEPVLELPGARVIGVKTTRRQRHKNGEVSAAQIDRVVARLRGSARGQLRVVVVHQPVQVTRVEDEHDRLHNWELALHAWADAGADVVMGGHIHLPYVCELSSMVAELGRRMWCVQAGTALSSRLRWEAPNSVNLLRSARHDQAGEEAGVDAGAVPEWQAERWDFIASSGEFELVKSQQMVPDRGGAPVAAMPVVAVS